MKMSRGALSWLLLIIVAIVSTCRTSYLRGRDGARTEERERLYYLPYKAGTRHTCVQGGPGPFSHSGLSRYAIDFGMPVGTPILAARGGRVVWVKEDSNIGGTCREYSAYANYVRILHEDETNASYAHLKKNGVVVEIGQQVRRGQLIGYSGNTGWSAMPHLHFQVDIIDPSTGRCKSIPIAFCDIAGDGVPRFLRIYKSGNVLAPLD